MLPFLLMFLSYLPFDVHFPISDDFQNEVAKAEKEQEFIYIEVEDENGNIKRYTITFRSQ